MTLSELKQRAESCNAELFILYPGKKLPHFAKGEKFNNVWLCVPPETDQQLIYAAATHFDRVYVFKKEEQPNEVSE